MNLKKLIISIILVIIHTATKAQTVNVSVDINAERKVISPLIYGKNNALSDNQSSPLSNYEWQRLKDAGIRIVREFGGNNGTKYNWRLKLSSHPDWYNNVYSHNWNYAAQSLQSNLPGVQGMWCFQLIGKAASNTNNNFNDWNYNGSNWWSGVAQNLAGGGVVNPAGGDQALTEGNPDLYLMNWDADSTTGILNYWFNSLHLNENYLKYWSMDNESEIWNGTHDDVMPVQLSAEEYMQNYFTVANKARAAFPDIKLMGPVPCNEWQWFTWNNATISYNGQNYCWLEFFIKRIAEEEQESGVRLLDVLDIHFYPGSSEILDILQVHRVFFDENYVYPGANGVKTVNGGWDNSINKEYIFKRCNDWLTEYLGPDHSVTLSVSEMDVNTNNANIVANWYASMLGTFAKNGVEVFTPWSWKTGMWEVLHLFSNYFKTISIKTSSENEENLSAFASINTASDSITLILVNRSQSSTYNVLTQVANFNLSDGNYETLTLGNLPSSETFISKSDNALQSSLSIANGGVLNVSVDPLSIKAVILTGTPLGFTNEIKENKGNLLTLRYDQEGNVLCKYILNKSSKLLINVSDISGRELFRAIDKDALSGNYQYTIDKGNLPEGIYIISVSENGQHIVSKKFKM